MRRRIGFAMAAVMGASLSVGVGFAGAASPAATKLTKLGCKMSVTTEPPHGSNTVNQPASQGSQYGPLHCARPSGFGGGVVADVFTVPDTGNVVGKYTQYFKTGSVTGTFNLAPEEGTPISVTSFESQSYQGKVTIAGGTGTYAGIKAKNATGVMTCTTQDSVHYSCKEKIKLTAI